MALSKDSEVRIVLLGKTGSGKSSTGNTILGKEELEVDSSFLSITKESKRVSRDLKERSVMVIDTPGLFDTEESKDEMKAEIVKALELAYPGPHVFLLVFRLDVKLTGEERMTMKWFEENFGEEVRKYIIVLFTHGNELNKSKNKKTVEEYLREYSDFKKLVDSMAGCHVFENEDGDEAQVTELLDKIDKLKERNKSQMYTKTMYETHTQIRAQQKPQTNEPAGQGLAARVWIAAAAARGAVTVGAAVLVGYALAKARL